MLRLAVLTAYHVAIAAEMQIGGPPSSIALRARSGGRGDFRGCSLSAFPGFTMPSPGSSTAPATTLPTSPGRSPATLGRALRVSTDAAPSEGSRPHRFSHGFYRERARRLSSARKYL